MSIQEMKNIIHQLVNEVNDEIILEEVGRILSEQSDHDILDDLTDEQLASIEKAREEVQNGNYVTLADFKRKMETKWPQLKSL